jgi:hypothetical protein
MEPCVGGKRFLNDGNKMEIKYPMLVYYQYIQVVEGDVKHWRMMSTVSRRCFLISA